MANYGEIKGTVKDTQGLTIPFANVTLLQNDQVVQAVTTDFDGKYEMNEVTVGRYSLNCQSDGFKPTTYEVVQVDAGRSTYLDFSLQQDSTQS